eukprot:3699017-Pleurochrysis_carterae.AAC.1
MSSMLIKRTYLFQSSAESSKKRAATFDYAHPRWGTAHGAHALRDDARRRVVREGQRKAPDGAMRDNARRRVVEGGQRIQGAGWGEMAQGAKWGEGQRKAPGGERSRKAPGGERDSALLASVFKILSTSSRLAGSVSASAFDRIYF